MNGRPYAGAELEIFERARKWKGYFGSFIHGYLRGRVLEVGAGRGGTTLILCDGRQDSWLCLEPDEALAEILHSRIRRGDLPSCCAVQEGTLDDLDPAARFDAILYADVLEHIPDDRRELEKAAGFIRERGYLVMVSPAHESLMSPIDARLGHCRRYNLEAIRSISPPGMEVRELRYLDSFGFFCSLMNRFFLRQEIPSSRQISFWDGVGIPISRAADRLLGNSFGRSLLAVWERSPAA
jgi:SAM-dependent methyltransferase